jgi:hypothetical protein
MYKQIEGKHKWIHSESGQSVVISQDRNNLYVTKRSSPNKNGIMEVISEKKFGNPLNKIQQDRALQYAKIKFNL